MSGKRKEYISWDAYFLGIAAISSFRSKDPSTQNGCCIVDSDSLNILATGYNGFCRGCSDDEFPWAREGESKGDTKYPFVEHSERNAIYSAARNGISLKGSVLYLYSEKGYYPCDECARAIIQAGIKEVKMAWAIDGDTDVYSWAETMRMFNASGVEVKVLCCGSYHYDLGAEEVGESIGRDFGLMAKKMKNITLQLKESK